MDGSNYQWSHGDTLLQLPQFHVLVDGIVIPSPPSLDIRQHVDDVMNMKIRDDDVFLCAPLKAGTHWTWEVIVMLLRGEAAHDIRSKIALMLDVIPVTHFDKMISPRVINTHFLYRHLPRQCKAKKTKIVYVTRNAKDVAVSLYHHFKGLTEEYAFNGSFTEFLHQYVLSDLPSIWNYFFVVRDWETAIEDHPDHPILQLNYEDMKEDLTTQVRRLADFLELEVSEALVQEVTAACSFSNMKRADCLKTINPMATLFQPDYTMYRKGEVGDWKNWFTVAECEKFDQFYQRVMGGSQMTFRQTL